MGQGFSPEHPENNNTGIPQPLPSPQQGSDSPTAVRQKQPKTKKGSILSDFLFAFVLSFFLLLTLVLVGTKLLGYELLTIDSGSMEPHFPIDSLILVKHVDPATLKENDVITFAIDENGTLVTHRIMAAKPTERVFLTKGDANELYDASPVLWSNVVGKAELCLPKVGSAFRLLTAEKNRVYVYIAIGILAGLMILWFVLDHLKKKKRTKTEKAVPKKEVTPSSGRPPSHE